MCVIASLSVVLEQATLLLLTGHAQSVRLNTIVEIIILLT